MPYPLTALPKAVFWAAPLRTWEYSTKQLRFLFAKEFWKETKKPKKPMDVTWNRCLGDCRMCHAHSCQVLETRFVTCEGLSDRNQTQLIINSSQTTIYLLDRLEYEWSTKLYQTHYLLFTNPDQIPKLSLWLLRGSTIFDANAGTANDVPCDGVDDVDPQQLVGLLAAQHLTMSTKSRCLSTIPKCATRS